MNVIFPATTEINVYRGNAFAYRFKVEREYPEEKVTCSLRLTAKSGMIVVAEKEFEVDKKKPPCVLIDGWKYSPEEKTVYRLEVTVRSDSGVVRKVRLKLRYNANLVYPGGSGGSFRYKTERIDLTPENFHDTAAHLEGLWPC